MNKDLSEIIKFCHQNYNSDNVTGVVANLCFMSDKEMIQEYHPDYYRDGSLIRMFEITTSIAREIIPNNISLIFSIEGCDKLYSLDDLEKLYELGLRAIAPVWNEANQYGSGIRTNKHLTQLGRKLIKKALNMGIAIDLSHANYETFNDIIDLIEIEKSNGLDTLVYASHSNCYSLCNRIRNLTDQQIKRLRDIGGFIGIFSNSNFVSLNNSNMTNNKLQEEYLNHIRHVEQIYGGINHIVLSTDDMKWCSNADSAYGMSQIFPYKNLQKELKILLSNYYSKSDVDKLMHITGEKIYQKINNRNKLK